MKKGIVITIDGPSGAGKGTVARELAKRLGLHYLDTGAMYRAVALSARRKGIDIDDDERLKAMLGSISIAIEQRGDGTQAVLLDGVEVTEEIRKPEIANLASKVATKPFVRNFLVRLQREMALQGGIVAEGRDMGTVVFPSADFKFYLDADLAERVRRRWLELKAGGIEIGIAELTEQIARRDEQDSKRGISPLHPAEDAVIIDTTSISANQVVEIIMNAIKRSRGERWEAGR
ncbi:MAG: (d)CMP kinase [Candidatus Methanosuratincola sp.]|jgi:cytidylate kinase